jgi:hypothetical protein
MTIDQAYNFLMFAIRKNQIVQITPTQFQFAFNKAQRDYFDMLIGHVEQFRYNDATPRVALGMDNKISSDLSPFKVNNQVITVSSGIAAYPTNFQYLALMTDSNGKKIEWISDEKLPARINDPIDNYLDSGKSFYNEGATGWAIYGAAASSTVTVNYYTKPIDVVWAYTISGGRPVYSAAGGSGVIPTTGSVQPVWDDNSMEEILSRAARILGYSFEKQSLIQLGDSTINRGE